MSQRRLVLVRHAEAESARVDRDRRLTRRGEGQATAVGAWLTGLRLAPDRVVVSPARRTRQTWDRARAALDGAPEAEVDERIYDNSADAVLQVLGGTDEDVRTLVLVGHNPAVGQLAHDLDDGAGDATARQDMAKGFPPGAVAVFEVADPLATLEGGDATLVEFWSPPS